MDGSSGSHEEQTQHRSGLWERWDRDGEPIESCAIITTEANELMAPIHGRMPVVLPSSAYRLWLDAAVRDSRKLLPLLRPYPADEMEAYPVGRLVNDPANDVPGCVRRVG